MVSELEDLIIIGAVIFGIVILKDALSTVEDTLGIKPLPTSEPPSPPVNQTIKYSANCPAGYIEDSDGNCIQVTGAIRP